jgi:hypothetical protein
MNAIARTEPPQDHPMVAESETATILSIVARAASDPNIDIDKMERLMQMQERAVARQAEQAFNVALNRAQARMGRVQANRTNPQTRSDYADYAALDRVLRPIYTEGGFSLSFDTGAGAPDGHIRVLCHVSHAEGHTRTYQADMPVDGKGAKGNDVMTKTHATGSGMSYGMRYLLKMIFNVAIGETDDDGNAAGQASKGRPTDGVWASLDQATQIGLEKLAVEVRDYLDAGEPASAMARIQRDNLNADEKTGLWTLLNSAERSALKKADAKKAP